MEYDLELISGFIDETRDVIEEAEPTLIELSHNSAGTVVDAETINAVFRLFHSLKSSAAFLGFNNVAKLTHEAESLIQDVREGRLALNGDLASLLCTSTDLIGTMLDTIEEKHSDAGFEETIKENLSDLKAFNPGNASSPEPAVAPQAPTPPVETARPAEATPQKPTPNTPTMEETMKQELFTPEMYQNFVIEGTEQLETVEEKFLSLEKNGFEKNEIDEACRAIDGFKGNSSRSLFARERLSCY